MQIESLLRLLSGILVTGLYLYMLWTGVRKGLRKYPGWRLIIHGIGIIAAGSFLAYYAFEDRTNMPSWFPASGESIMLTIFLTGFLMIIVGGKSWLPAVILKGQSEKLRLSEERLNLAMEASQGGYWDWDIPNRTIYHSPGWLQSMGYDPEDVPADQEWWIDKIHPEDLPAVTQAYQDHLEGKTPMYSVEMRMRGYDGRYEWFQEKGRLVKRGEQGEPLRFIGSHANITSLKGALEEVETARDRLEEKVAERARSLFQERHRLQIILHTISDAVIAADIDGKVMLINPAAEILFGLSAPEAEGKPQSEIIKAHDEESGEPIDIPTGRILQDRQIYHLDQDIVLVNGAGKTRYLLQTLEVLREKDGSAIGTLIVLHDMTHRREYEREVIKSQRLESLGILAGGLAHDFNNFLTGIMLNVASATYMSKSSPEVTGVLKKIEQTVERAKGITQQLLTFARGGAPVKSNFNLAPLLKETVKFSLHGRSILPVFELEDELWSVSADPDQLAQVINNLIINAQQAMADGGNIHIQARNIELAEGDKQVLHPPGEYVQITLADQGTGMPPEVMSKIFDPYFTTKEEGNGLGLYTVYAIMNKHGGWIDVESEPGKGSTFTLYLPAARGAVEGIPAGPGPQAGAGRILLMDDDDGILTTQKQLLQQLGYVVEATTDGEAAISAYKAALDDGRSFNVVVLDLTIQKGLGGLDTIKAMKKIDPDVRALVASGYSNSNVLSEPEKHGFVGVLKKPYTVESLNSAILAAMQ